MLNFIRGLLTNPVGTIEASVRSLISTVVGGLASLLDTIFGNVDGAWHDLASAFDDAEGVIKHFTSAVFGHLWQIVTHDIPVFAQTAYWWVTHPGDLANVLFWHLMRALENQAWQVAQWLGEFITATLVRNIRQVAALAETVLAALL